MGRPYQVVISPDDAFFLLPNEIRALSKLNQEWAMEICKNFSSLSGEFYPSEKELPRHSLQLIHIARNIDRFEIVDLVVRFWPPKYHVNKDSNGKESIMEPCTIPWKTVYYPEQYSDSFEMTDEEFNRRRIKAIAP